jgi:hypothetical protein
MTVGTDVSAEARTGQQTEVDPVDNGSAPLASGTGPRHGWRTVLLAGAGYLLLSVFVWSNVWTSHPTSVTTCGCGDSSLFTWYMEWPAYAISHGLNLFHSSAMNYPTGVNIPANTSELAISVPLVPITWLFGPVAALNVALTLSPALSALAMFVLLRRWVSWTPAALIGGLFYGFSPFIVFELTDAHLMLGMAAVPPLVVACLDELLIRQRRCPVRIGILLGFLVALQFFIGSELLVMMVIVGVVGVGLVVAYAAWRHPEALRAKSRHAVVGVSAGVATAGVLLAYPVWYALAGPGHFSGPIWPGKVSSIRSASTSLNGYVQQPSNAAMSYAHALYRMIGGYQGPVTNRQYLGFGLLAVLAGGLVAWRRDRRLWLFAALAAVSVVLSLGAPKSVLLPWQLVQNLPLLENVIPMRFVFFTYLAVAVMLGLIIDHTRTSVSRWREAAQEGERGKSTGDVRSRLPRWGGVAAALLVAVIALLQPAAGVARTVPVTTQPVVLPAWFRTVAPHLGPHQVLLIFPSAFSSPQTVLTWQAVNRMRYSMVNGGLPVGLLTYTGKEHNGAGVIQWVSLLPELPEYANSGDLAYVRQALGEWGVTTVVIPDQPNLPPYDQIPSVTVAAALITAATGELPVHQADAWVWTDVDKASERTLPSGARFYLCVKGKPSHGASAVDAATRCVLDPVGG